MKEDVDILLMPYNYLMDQQIFKLSIKEGLSNTIIILDEAHNIE